MKIRGSWAGGRYDPHPMEWKFLGGGGSKTKVFSLGGYEYFLKLHNFNSIRGSQTLGDGLCASSLFRVANKTIHERTRSSITLLPRAARVCLSRYLPQRVCSQAMMGWTSKNVLQQGHFSISYLDVNAGCKENRFYSLSVGQADARIYVPKCHFN